MFYFYYLRLHKNPPVLDREANNIQAWIIEKNSSGVN